MVSSAYRSTYNFRKVSISSFVETFLKRLLSVPSPLYFSLKNFSKSLIKRAKRSGEKSVRTERGESEAIEDTENTVLNV